MDKVILVYIIIQLLLTAFGLAVIEAVRPVIEKKLYQKGYVQRNRNSLYNFNDSLLNIAKGFIPGYYFVKALKLIGDKKKIDIAVEKEIRNGNYVKPEKNIEISKKDEVKKVEEKRDPTIAYGPEIIFEKPEKYKARKNDVSLYDTYETPVEYIIRETEKEEDDKLTPFISDDKVVEQVVVKENITKSDIAKAIAELDEYELELLASKITSLAESKKVSSLKLEKDVA